MTDAFRKHDAGKPRYSLLPPRALEHAVRALMHGADKYGHENYLNATEADEQRYWDATQRHLWAVMRGEDIDPDSGLTHLSCATANLLLLAEINEAQKRETPDQ